MRYLVPALQPAAAYDEAVEVFAYVKGVHVTSVILPIPDRGKCFYVGQHDPKMVGVTYFPHVEGLNARDLIKRFKNSNLVFSRPAYRTFMAVHAGTIRKLNKAGCKISCQDGTPHIDRTHTVVKLQNKSVLRFRFCRLSELALHQLEPILEAARAQIGVDFNKILCKTSHGRVKEVTCLNE